MKSKISILLVVLLVASLGSVFAAGKTDAPATSRYLNWNVGADPKTIDPVLNGASDGGDVINQT
ncbi:MAG: peptide ABC transporter substrate-binding protein, partial [Clostridia bacterium]